jgi:hypothetical protein
LRKAARGPDCPFTFGVNPQRCQQPRERSSGLDGFMAASIGSGVGQRRLGALGGSSVVTQVDLAQHLLERKLKMKMKADTGCRAGLSLQTQRRTVKPCLWLTPAPGGAQSINHPHQRWLSVARIGGGQKPVQRQVNANRHQQINPENTTHPDPHNERQGVGIDEPRS